MKIAEVAETEKPCVPPDLLSLAARQISVPTPGYCHACGTWDLHLQRCACCGFDFDAQTPTDDY